MTFFLLAWVLTESPDHTEISLLSLFRAICAFRESLYFFAAIRTTFCNFQTDCDTNHFK
jgi:hypothetical protein